MNAFEALWLGLRLAFGLPQKVAEAQGAVDAGTIDRKLQRALALDAELARLEAGDPALQQLLAARRAAQAGGR